MTIASLQLELIGARIYTPEGPLDLTGRTGPLPNFRAGEIAGGDQEAEFVPLFFAVSSAPQTVNQGDLVAWDNNGNASLVTTAGAVRGQSIGGFFLGGRFGDPGAVNAPFSYTFTVNGTYLIWAQRAGIGLMKAASTALANTPAQTTTTPGQADAPASPTVGTKSLLGLFPAVASVAFTANTTNGSAVITNLSSVVGLYPNQTIAGTGIPGSTTVLSINGNPGNYTITMSAAATATGTAVAITANGYVEGYFKWPYVDKTN